MNRKEGSFGMVGLLLVMGVVLFLVARNWKAIAPQVLATSGSSASVGPGDDATIRPSLPEARQKTDGHSDDVQKALAAAE